MGLKYWSDRFEVDQVFFFIIQEQDRDLDFKLGGVC
jgi:hypothetical protein